MINSVLLKVIMLGPSVVFGEIAPPASVSMLIFQCQFPRPSIWATFKSLVPAALKTRNRKFRNTVTAGVWSEVGGRIDPSRDWLGTSDSHPSPGSKEARFSAVELAAL